MSADYAPGTVAVATVKGKAGVRVVRYDTGYEQGWYAPVGLAVKWHDREVTDVRPLVVLDIDDVPLVDKTPKQIRGYAEVVGRNHIGAGEFLDWFADQIEAQTKPPRIPEPGLWGVVKADRRFWVRDNGHPTHEWVAAEATMRRSWDDLIDPTLIRDGVTP